MPKLLIFLAIGFLEVSCTSPESERFAYVDRVASVLEAESIKTTVVLVATPTERELRLPTPEQKINPLQFADLHRCDMGDLVGERNSGLGRFAPASQRLGYEVRWLCRAHECDIEWIEELALSKQASLAPLFWNATIGGPEFSGFLRRDSGAVDTQALLALNEYSLGDCNAQQDEFEEVLYAIQRSGGVKGRRAQWAMYRESLTNVTTVLERLERPVCLSNKPTAKAERLFAVFRRFYVEELQPRMSRSLRLDRAWIEALYDVQIVFGDLRPGAWHNFYSQTLDPRSDGSEWQATHQAIVTHSQAWQHIFNQCGVDIRAVAGAS